ncbi:MAG: S-layer family protein, partial [Microcoleaceae cyanobacterium]
NIQLNNAAVVDVSGEGSGDIQIQGRQITITEGSTIVANTLGSQHGGNVLLTASELIEVTGVSADGQNLSSVLTNVVPGATGNGGELTINTQTIKVDRGELRANVLGEGPGGNVTINTQNLMLNNGGLIVASTSGSGQAGNITIDANEIEVVGMSADGRFPSGINTQVNSTGNGGNLTIDTQRLIMRDGAIIEGGVFSSGQGGNITINATEISLSGNAMSDNILPEISNIVQVFQGQFSNIVLTVVGPNATGKGGDITIDTQSLQLSDGSLIGTGTVGLGDSGDLTIRATEIDMTGTTPIGLLPTSVYTTVYSEGKGNGGNLTIDTERLSLRNGAQLRAGTNASGNSGDLILRATEIELIGGSESGIFASSILTSVEDFTVISLARGSGEGGNAFIETERLTILDGAEVSANTFGDGSAGSLTINASDNITLSGSSPINGNSSAITASTELGATKAGGNLNITTPTLNLSDAAVVTARSFNNSSGGNITLNVDTLNLASGAQILSSSFSDGNAGTISINADSAIALSGSDRNFNDRVAIFGVERLDTDGAESAISSQTTGEGNAGSVSINTPQLRVEDKGLITVSSFGSGVAGSLNINAPSIQLNNGTLSAETASGDEGNISIKANQINLKNHSAITTNAMNTATGGDINIDTQFIIGLDDSNITANAVEGQGGNISIGAEGVFLDNSSQITATSALGIDGTVNINTQVDPTQGVVRLSPTVIDAQSLVAKNLCAPTQGKKEGSSFVITGRGGLPPDPTQPLTVLRGIVGWETDTEMEMSERKQSVVVYSRQQSANVPEIRQAQGWAMTEGGKVILTTAVSIANTGGLQLIHPSCYVFISNPFNSARKNVPSSTITKYFPIPPSPHLHISPSPHPPI